MRRLGERQRDGWKNSETNEARNRRRTRQSGPLGELFDHGVDALNTSLEVIIFAGSQNMGQGWYTIATLFACRFFFLTNNALFPSNRNTHAA